MLAYRFIVDYFIHVTSIARPDMLYVTGLLAAAYARPTPLLLSAARRAAVYLYKTRRLGLRRHTHVAPDNPTQYIVADDTIRIGFQRSTSTFGTIVQAEFYDFLDKDLTFSLTNTNAPPTHLLDLQRVLSDNPAPKIPNRASLTDPGFANVVYLTSPVSVICPTSMTLFTKNLPPSRFRALRNKVLYVGT